MAENLIVSINCVTPIFISLAVGYLAKVFRVVPVEVFPQINRLCFSVLLAFMMFNNVYSADFSNGIAVNMIGFLLAATFALFFGAKLILAKAVDDFRLRGTYMQNAYRSNLSIIGLSLAEILCDAEGVSLMAVTITILGPIYNILAVIALETSRSSSEDFGKTVKIVLKNPFVLGALLALLCRLLRIHIPSSVASAIASLGKAGMTMALLALGAAFEFTKLGSNLRRIVIGSLMRLIIIPFLVVAAAVALGFRNNELSIILIAAATPLATSAYPMAQVYGSDHELTGQLVVVTSLFCCATLFLWILSLKQLRLI